MIRYATALGLLLATTTLASAQSLDDQIADFMGAPGFAMQDIARLNDRLDQMWLDTDSISPGGAVGPLEKAIMIAETDIGSTHTRSAIAYGQVIAEDGTPVSFIDVRHYNMAAPLHAAAVAAYGAENVAAVSAFGEGDHKAWRFVFQPVMNNAAILIEAGSRTISDKEASKDDCTGRPCLELAAGFDETLDWIDIEGTPPSWPELYPSALWDVAIPASAIAQLAVLGFWANAESGSYEWTGGEHPESVGDAAPYRYIGIDRNLGQDDSIEAVWNETALNDDTIAAVAYRYIGVPGQTYRMQASQPR